MSESTPSQVATTPAKTTFFSSIDWAKVLAAVATAIFGGLVTVAYGYLTAKEPQLRYSIDDPVHFKGNLNRLSMSTFSVANEGNKSAEDVECSLRVGKTIKEVKIGPDHLNATHTVGKDGAIVVKLKRLNPTEKLTVSVLSDELIDRMDVDSVRGDGVNGELQKPKTTGMSATIIWFSIIGNIAWMTAAIFSHLTNNRTIKSYREIVDAKSQIIESYKKSSKSTTAQLERMVTELENMRRPK